MYNLMVHFGLDRLLSYATKGPAITDGEMEKCAAGGDQRLVAAMNLRSRIVALADL